MRPLWLLLIVLVLSACAGSLPEPPPSHPTHAFRLDGDLSIVTANKIFSGRIDWQHDANADLIVLYSPWGGRIAQIEKTAQAVTFLDAKGKILRAATAEKLTEQALGWRLPLTSLSDWVLGRTTTQAIEAPLYNAQGRLTSFAQNGWRIEYLEYADKQGLPQKILLKSAEVTVKMFIRAWSKVGEE